MPGPPRTHRTASARPPGISLGVLAALLALGGLPGPRAGAEDPAGAATAEVPAAEAPAGAALPPILPPRDEPAAAPRPRAGDLDPAALPAEQQAGYRLLEDKCARCHGVATALAGRSAERVERHLRRMATRPGAAVSAAQVRAIGELLEWLDRRGAQAGGR